MKSNFQSQVLEFGNSYMRVFTVATLSTTVSEQLIEGVLWRTHSFVLLCELSVRC